MQMTEDEERLTRLEKMISDSRKGMDIEREIAVHAGRDYAKRRNVVVDNILFEDIDNLNDDDGPDRLIEAITEFKANNPCMTFQTLEGGDHYDIFVGFEAIRSETPEEVSARIDGYRKYVLQREAVRRAEYERMKREFGDA